MKRTIVPLIVLPLMALACLLLPGLGPTAAPARLDPASSDQPALTEGMPCIVQFRRDALGLAARTIVSPSDRVFGDGRVSIRGPYLGTSAGWIVLGDIKDDERAVWIPREVILTIETGAGK